MPGGASHDLWVFGYGSLMWQPGFQYAEAHHARLNGYRRALCIYSVYYRGTYKRPGLVLGLDRGGVCEGVAFRVEAAHVASVLDYLRRRELIYPVYRETHLAVTLVMQGRPEVMALAYIAERLHPSFAGELPLGRQAALVRGAAGATGTNIDYLANTISHLEELGIREPRLRHLQTMVGAFTQGTRKDDRIEGRNSGSGRARALARAHVRLPVPVPNLRLDERNRFGYRRFLNADASPANADAN